MGCIVGGWEMGFGEAIRVCFSKYADFSGRASRSEYWFFILFCILVRFGANILNTIVVSSTGMAGLNIISAMAMLALALPQLSAQVRRLHDTGRSGFWVLGFILYVIGAIIAFFSLFGVRPDAGGSASLVLIALILIGTAYAVGLVALTALKGTEGANRYGPDPLGPDVTVF